MKILLDIVLDICYFIYQYLQYRYSQFFNRYVGATGLAYELFNSY